MGDNFRAVQPLYGRKVRISHNTNVFFINLLKYLIALFCYLFQVTANGLGAPLVIKHTSQEVQRDQWYWSMVSGLVWHCQPLLFYLYLKISLQCSPITSITLKQVPGWAVVLLCLAVAANVAVLVNNMNKQLSKYTLQGGKYSIIYMKVKVLFQCWCQRQVMLAMRRKPVGGDGRGIHQRYVFICYIEFSYISDRYIV